MIGIVGPMMQAQPKGYGLNWLHTAIFPVMLKCYNDVMAANCWHANDTQINPGLLMRTTLTLADDVSLIARQVAKRERISLGEAVSRLARDGFRVQPLQPATKIKPRSKYSVLPARDEIITTEHVRRLMDEEGI